MKYNDDKVDEMVLALLYLTITVPALPSAFRLGSQARARADMSRLQPAAHQTTHQ